MCLGWCQNGEGGGKGWEVQVGGTACAPTQQPVPLLLYSPVHDQQQHEGLTPGPYQA